MNLDAVPHVLDGPGSHRYRSPTCTFCRHCRGERICLAFPEGIPEEIWSASGAHKEPWPGDQGIQFDPEPLKDRYDIPEFLKKPGIVEKVGA